MGERPDVEIQVLDRRGLGNGGDHGGTGSRAAFCHGRVEPMTVQPGATAVPGYC